MHQITLVRPPLARWPLVLSAVWLGVTLAGLWLLWLYAGTAGAADKPPPHWPGDSKITRNPRGATLVMFAHPHCPCTRASMGELEKIVARCEGSVEPWIVFYLPQQADADWEKTDLWKSAAAIPGAHVISDLDGVEAGRFHALTSGQTIVYGADGKLLFGGGITSARGHAGDNDGESAVVELLTSGTATCRESPVFGCPIVETPPTR